MREVIVDLPSHALDLLADACGELGLARARRPLGLLREHRQRRLQAVREVAGLGDRTADDLLAVVEQAVEVVDERLHFTGIGAFDAMLLVAVNRRQA